MTEMLVHWLLAAVFIMVTANIVPGFKVQNFPSALLAALVVGFVNTLIWPLLTFLTLPLTVVTFGLFLLVVNGICLKLSAAITPGFAIRGFMPAMLGSVVLTVLGWLLHFVFFPHNTTAV